MRGTVLQLPKRDAIVNLALLRNSDHIQVVLDWDDATRPTWPGCELPILETSHSAGPMRPLSPDGSIGFGDVLVATGTGRVAREPGAGSAAVAAVTCRVKVQLKGVELLGAEGVDFREWLTVWEKELLFSDDAATVARVAEMSQAQKRHAAHAKVRTIF